MKDYRAGLPFALQALAEAIRAVTDMNPDLSVEKIEIRTESEAQE